MKSILLAFSLLLMATIVARAQSCGGPDEPCHAGGGDYHVAAPVDPLPRRAVIFLHGYGGTGEGIIRNRNFIEAIAARGYAVIAPQGSPMQAGGKGGSWNSFGRADRRDDIAFIAAVADDAAKRFGLDRGTMLLAGFSGGGMMTWRAACDAPGAFAAYAPIAGLLWRPLPERCAGPFAMLHTHGWSDQVVPLEGRSVASGRFTQGDLFKGLKLLRATLGCARDDPDGYGEKDGYLIRRWDDCAAGAALEMALHPGGHMIPPRWSALALDWFEGLKWVKPASPR
ncbi:MAG: polyhydroxybutyrate depolymerase [Paracoccaceae bacterium]